MNGVSNMCRAALIMATVIETLVPVSPAVAAPGVRSGTLVLNVTIEINSAIPTTTPIKCLFMAGVSSSFNTGTPTPSFNYLNDNTQVLATRQGKKAICSLKIPYFWSLYDVDSAKIDINYSVIATDANGIGRTFLKNTLGIRSPDTLPVPPNGTITTINRTVKL